ncbi:putative berberine/berberine, FAD-binding domain, PCMH-type, FAD-binding, type PCMH, subdomain 1 [Helianthus annuus]|uniref:Berberine/berberine, FAD-binding domain, PCMH-type, FAD-binding, type PCMH, subdomain 1 n=2 Tax=Helianthus annuus TaxID=4232 RepID=A0A251UWE9_HELAN|nr:putative berberine/berberine, FAD-binding domain, PCMH-type, FAD-binding, type PCMH, subdomain 1 [Helianthus annuus]KAJ0579955.1 putative berberine/berberine, FAD-binding domain, PCMH-type, FAD-binding, type PCMH, subdomain 1 [Helianthus annuus]KAJ0587287.1 putative berberine/berberine, FAD-binding domain, PCMH-type, FAD-binding, type PCMH, subdomain 1 [Helianthus annuus]KAJ0756527.1 putative berberine/berberine, FAD-binding domain, PCMH-type, FAD-binding, type PCMH, subdomain 1 [Helianthus a
MSVSVPSFVYEHEHEHEHEQEKHFVMSLTRLGVHNFSTRSNSNNDSSSVYHQLLNLSIQNLRFAGSSLPKPVVIVFPETKEQLANTVICARESSLEIRVRCGGHSYEGTSSVAMDGCPFVVIDLTRLDRVSVDVDSGTAWVEGGATLGQTYYAISESSSVHGFSAGSCPTVGVGGHISGGGFGLLSRKYGLAADNVVDAVLVTADGKLLNRAAMGEDVFWAIRGGGGGVWGIVYAWNIKLSSVPDTVTCFIVSRSGTKEQVADMVDKWQRVAPTLPDDFYMSSFVGAGLPERKDKPGLSATFKGLYLGPKAKALLIMNQNFHELKIVENDCKEMSWIESVLYFSGFGDQSSVSDLKNQFLQDKLYYKAKSDFVRKLIPRLGLTIMLDILEKQSKGYVILDPYGGMMESISSDSIPFPHRKGNLFTIQYLVEWKEADNDKTDDYIAWIRGFHGSMTPYVAQDPRAAYVNYMDVDLGVMNWNKTGVKLNDDVVETGREWGEKYFGNNYDRLVKAKTEIDPFNVFRHQQSIPPMSLEYKNSKGSRLSE